MAQSLLTNEAGIFERAIESAELPRWQALVDAFEGSRGFKYKPTRITAFDQFLLAERGLTELLPYLTDIDVLFRDGVEWQRVRGTILAISYAMKWVGYDITVEEANPIRNYWNSFQIRFKSFPERDTPDLERIEGVVSLSVPKRSQLRRGVYLYDVTALVANDGQLNQTMLDRESGVTFGNTKAIWSFGRVVETDHTLTQDEGVRIGNWIAPVDDSGIPWATMKYPWTTANFQWSANPALARQILMAAFFPDHSIYARIDGPAGIVGYRRCIVHQVKSVFDGPYTIGEDRYDVSESGPMTYIEALTAFEDGAGMVATRVQICVNPILAPNVPPGRLWLSPNEASGGQVIAETPVNIQLRPTVRDRFKFLLRF